MFSAIAQLTRSSKLATKVQGELRSDIQFWSFLGDWSDCLPWRSEQHCFVILFGDASKRSCRGVLIKDGKRVESRDYWLNSLGDINSLEARALLHSLLAFRDHIRDSRVDTHIDNRTLKTAWRILAARVPLLTSPWRGFYSVVVGWTLLLMFVSSRLATTQRTYHRGCVLTSTACCPRKPATWWSVILVRIHLT